MCGLRSGIIFFDCSFSLFLLCLAPDSFAAISSSNPGVSSNGRTFTASPDSNGSWRVRDAQIPAGRYYPSEMPNPSVNANGNITDLWSTPNLPVPYDSSGIPGISEADLVQAGDIAAVAAPYLAQLAALDPQARAAIGGASALWGLWQAYYNATNPDVGGSKLPSSTYYCGSTAMTAPSGQDWIPAGTYCFAGRAAPCSGTNGCFGNPSSYYCSANNVAPSSNAPSCSNGATASAAPSGSSSPSTAKVPAPSATQLQAMFNKTKSDALSFLQNMPQSVTSQIPMTQTASGPASFSSPSTSSSSSSSSGTTTTTNNNTYNLTYSGPAVKVAAKTNTQTTTCTTSGVCSVVNSSAPLNLTPFVPPTANYPKVSTSVPTNSVPFTPFSFGAPWLPKTCPSAPTFQVCAIGGVDCQTEKLPTYVICQLASGIEPVVTTGGGLLGVLILAW